MSSECQCDEDGSVNNSCTDDGGVCTCNANIIGIKCDTCETGWFGFPSCQGEIYHYQWSTEPKQDLVLFHIFRLARFCSVFSEKPNQICIG